MTTLWRTNATSSPNMVNCKSLWILVLLCLLPKLESCPPVQTADLANCWNTEPCCFVEPIYIRDSFGFGCFKGCLKKCSKNCVNPCVGLPLVDLRDCRTTDPAHCDVMPSYELVKGHHCFKGCTQFCE
ncbi:uncharacterized protein LOC111114063 [Crassostrea virginica]